MKRVVFVIFSFVIILISCFYFLLKPYVTFYESIINIPLSDFILGKNLPKSEQEIRFILLGIGGSEHEGSNLTDSIQLVNLDLKNFELNILGFPRDVWIDEYKDKINTLYTYAEEKELGSGLNSIQKTLSKITNTQYRFTALIDFNHFSELIDILGGIDVEVKTTFVDNHYPIKGKENDLCKGDTYFKCRYKTLRFEAGKNHFDGETALAFVRSRYSEGEEGNDFARLQRQQLVIESIINKLQQYLSKPSPKKLTQLYQILDKAVIRNISNDELLIYGRSLLFDMKKIKIQKTSYPKDFFYFPPLKNNKYQGRYVLLPKNDDFGVLATLSACLLRFNNCD